MLYLLQTLSVWLLAAYGLGMIVGLFCWKGRGEDENPNFKPNSWPDSWRSFLYFVLPLVVGATVAWLRWLPGRYGLWLETALLLLAAYFVGCGFGCFSRGRFSGGTAAKPAPPARTLETRPAAKPAGEAPAAPEMTPDDMKAQAEALARWAAALAAAAPAALEVLQAAREMLVQAEAEAESQTEALEPPPSVPRPEPAEAEDDLRQIQGVDESIVRRLHELGVWRFEQIADWTPQDQLGAGEKLHPCGPQALRFWVAQARLLAGGVEPEFSLATPEAPLDEATAEKLLAALPQPIAPHGNDEIYAGLRPLALLLPPYGEKDDLCRISGVDAATGQRLNALGVWTFGQIARWSDDNARWIGSWLASPGRVERENWVGQARDLAKAGDASERFRPFPG